MSTARERHNQRKNNRPANTRTGSNRQVGKLDGFKIPQIKLPFPQWYLLIPIAILLALAVIAFLGLLNPREVQTATNAIWLNHTVSYANIDDAELQTLVQSLKDNQIGTIYVFASSLKADNNWSGDPTIPNNRFTEVETNLTNFVQRLRTQYPDVQIMAWLEVLASAPEYRLDSRQVRVTVSEFSGRLVNSLGFDGVMLDIKPIFDGNEDLPVILREVRGAVGLDTPIAVAVPADLTPTDANLNLPTFIAPNTVWSTEYKQRVSLQADQMVVTAYNSYIRDQVDYINWVRYQVETFTQALVDIDTPSQLLISIPNYTLSPNEQTNPIAHDPVAESMAGALDGVALALPNLSQAQFNRLYGVAIFTDTDLTAQDWQIFRTKWLDAPKTPAAPES
jgi:hypothetical protein